MATRPKSFQELVADANAAGGLFAPSPYYEFRPMPHSRRGVPLTEIHVRGPTGMSNFWLVSFYTKAGTKKGFAFFPPHLTHDQAQVQGEMLRELTNIKEGV